MTQQILSTKKLSIMIGVPLNVLKDVSSNKHRYYSPFIKKEIKKDGSVKDRKIDNPNIAIRQIQRRINKKLLQPLCLDLPINMTGSIPGRGIKDNATPHQRNKALLAVDISNCFPSISSRRVYAIFKTNLRCSPPVAKMLTKLTTYGNRLPQGSPASPSLCNLVLAPLVVDIINVAGEYELNYTQYVDDLTFSGKRNNIKQAKPIILKLIESYGFVVNPKKLKLSLSNERMEVTGLVINSKVSVGRRYIREVERNIMRVKPETRRRVKGKVAHVGLVSKKKANKLSMKLAKKEPYENLL